MMATTLRNGEAVTLMFKWRKAAAIGGIFVVCASADSAQAQTGPRLAWDAQASPTVTGYAVTIDGVRTNYGLTPLATNGTCGCSIPLGFSGGRHTVVVTAYNATAETPSAPFTVAPAANAGGPYSVSSGAAIAVSGAGSVAPTGSLTRYSWRWGDGSSDTASSLSSASHSYAATGSFTVTLTVTDNAGATASASTTATVTSALQAPLPAPWLTQDIGSVGLAGSAAYSSGRFTVAGAGADIWNTADSFRYVYQPLNGDGQIVARVTSMVNTNTFAKAGVMIRESLNANAPNALVNLRPGGEIEFLARATSGASTVAVSTAMQMPPTWVKLVRSGNSIVASVSTNGSSWSVVGTTTVTMASGVLVGLVVTSHDTSVLNTSVFDSVTVTTGGSASDPWLSQDIGSVGLTGSASYSSGRFTIAGAGDDIWNTADAFRYVYQPLSGDGQIVARVAGLMNTNTYAKAGVMIRGSLGASAANAIVDLRPGGEIEFLARDAAGASTFFVGDAAQSPPTWLKLVRAGSSITAYVSANGSTWTQVGSTSVTLGSTAYIGLAVTSHDTTALNTATLDSVTVTAGGGAPPPPASNGDVVIYASSIPAGARHGSWQVAGDPLSPNSVKLTTPDTGVSNTSAPLATPTDYVDVTFNAVANTPYRLWLRMRAAANSKWNDSMWVQFSDATVSGSPVFRMNTTSALLVNLATDSDATSLVDWGWQNTVYWLSQPTTVTFPTTGMHTIRIQVREDGTQFDQIVLSPSKYLNTPPGPVSGDSTILPTQ